MSTLTKILIVLLTISSIFLCGIVVTYVGSAENYQKMYEDRKRNIDRLETTNENLTQKLEDAISGRNDEVAKLNEIISAADKLNAQTTTDLTNARRELEVAQTREQNFEELVRSHTETIQENNKIVAAFQEAEIELRAQSASDQSEIEQLTKNLISREGELAQLKDDNRRLQEEKIQLRDKLDQYLQQIGKTAGPAIPVTTVIDKAQLAPPLRDINIEGNISEVDLQDSLVSLNIGSADNVKKGMRFHVTRGNKFICDIVISDVDMDKASGSFELVSDDQPRAGDIVKTNF